MTMSRPNSDGWWIVKYMHIGDVKFKPVYLSYVEVKSDVFELWLYGTHIDHHYVDGISVAEVEKLDAFISWCGPVVPIGDLPCNTCRYEEKFMHEWPCIECGLKWQPKDE